MIQTFMKKISDTFEEFNNRHTIVVGDINLVINPDVDYTNYLHINNQKHAKRYWKWFLLIIY